MTDAEKRSLIPKDSIWRDRMWLTIIGFIVGTFIVTILVMQLYFVPQIQEEKHMLDKMDCKHLGAAIITHTFLTDSNYKYAQNLYLVNCK